MKTCVLIPAHNEGHLIGVVLEDLKARGLDVVVIDDGSTDQTSEIARQAGAVVIRNEENEGKGLSLKKGFSYLLDKDYDEIILMDGDGQHSLEDLPQFIEKAKDHSPCFIIGNRMANHEGMPLLRLLTNRFMSMLISKICKQKISDTQCGYRLISHEVLKNIKLSSDGFEMDTEILVEASRKGYKIYSVPIKTIYGNESSHINPIKDSLRFFSYIIKQL